MPINASVKRTVPVAILAAVFLACSTQDTSAQDAEIKPLGPVEKVAGDFAFTEGPAWDPEHGCLYFTDIPNATICLLYTSPSPRDLSTSRMPSSA